MDLFHDILDIVCRTYSHIQTMYKLIILMLCISVPALAAGRAGLGVEKLESADQSTEGGP